MRQSEDPKELFGTMPVPSLFLRAALPGALGMVVSTIYSALDGVLVGNFVGETSFAAINLAMPYVIVLFAFGDLIGVGSAVPISIALGEGRDDDANNLFTCACVFNVAMGFVSGVALLVLAPLIFELMGASGELAANATLYLRVYAAFAPLTTIGYALDNYLRISGRIRRSLCANTFMAVFGAVLEVILLGPCDLGVGAAALSFSLAMVAAVLIALWPFLKGRLQLRFVRPRFSLRDLVEVVRCGFATFLDNIAGRLTSIVMNAALLAAGGEAAVSMYGVALFAEGIIIPIIYGTLDALQPAIGYNWGACQLGRVKALELWCFGAVAIVSVLFVGLVFAVPEPIVDLFLPAADAGFMAQATHVLKLVASAHLLRWFVFGTQSLLVNVGEVGPATLVSLCTAIAFPLPLIWLMAPWGIEGLWLNSLASAVLSCALSAVLLLRFRRHVRARAAGGLAG